MKNNTDLIHGNIGKTLYRLTGPMVFGLISVVIFNITDTFFIAKLGIKQLAALSFTFPVVLVIASFAIGLGVSTTAIISRQIGKNNIEKAKKLSEYSLILTLIISVLFIFLGHIAHKKVFMMLGVTQEIMPFVDSYMRIWYCIIPVVFLPIAGNCIIRSTGDTKITSALMIFAATTNVILDPLLIFGIGPFPELGIKGAVIATGIARGLALVLSMYFVIVRYKIVSLRIPNIPEMLTSWKTILYIGLPAAGMNIIPPFALGVITRLVSSYGHEAVAALGVGSRVEYFALIVITALAVVLSPFIGQNFGANRFDRIKTAVKISIKFSLGWGFISFILFFIFARYIALIFNKDESVTYLIVLYLRIISISYGFQGLLVIVSSILNILHKPIHAVVLRFAHVFVLYIPLAFIGKKYFNIPGIYVGVVVSFIIAGLVSWKLVYKTLKSFEIT